MPAILSYFEQLERLLPSGWRLDLVAVDMSGPPVPDGLVVVVAPDGSKGRFVVEAKTRISARQAAQVLDTWSASDSPLLVVARYISGTARVRLRDAGASYLDETGNAWIRMDRPAVFIERQGAATDPDPPRRGVQSLKGAKAARIVRGLCDWQPPMGVRELARRTDADPGYVTRVLSLLEEDDVVERGLAGEIEGVRWPDLLLRWSEDYSVTETNRASLYLAPRGLAQVQERLLAFDAPYALTGSFAVPPEARVAPGRVLTCYVTEPALAARALDARPADAGANVVLLEPFDPVVFERSRSGPGPTCVALSQCAIDLLTGTGREPAQAEALIDWMQRNEDEWRRP